MVIKYTKHEIEQTFKHYIPVFIMGVVGAVLVIGMAYTTSKAVTSSQDMPWAFSFMLLALFGVSIAASVIAIRAMLMVLYTNLYSVTGYRQFTYPITSVQRVIIKILTASFWNVIIGAFLLVIGFVTVLAIRAIIPGGEFVLEVIVDGIKEIFSKMDISRVLLSILSTITSSLLTIVVILLSGAFANSSWVRKNRTIMALIAYLVISVLMSQVSSLVLSGLFNSQGTVSGVIAIFGFENLLSLPGLLVSILMDFIFIIISVVGTIWLWENKLEILN